MELSARNTKLARVQEIAGQMSIKLEMLDIAAESPEQTERIQQIQPAMIKIE